MKRSLILASLASVALLSMPFGAMAANSNTNSNTNGNNNGTSTTNNTTNNTTNTGSSAASASATSNGNSSTNGSYNTNSSGSDNSTVSTGAISLGYNKSDTKTITKTKNVTISGNAMTKNDLDSTVTSNQWAPIRNNHTGNSVQNNAFRGASGVMNVSQQSGVNSSSMQSVNVSNSAGLH